MVHDLQVDQSCNVVSVDPMLISRLSVSVEALEMLCAVVAEALACNLKADDLLSPLCPSFSSMQV